jgi:hypothetical protein
MQPDLESVVAEIKSWHRQRCFAMEQRKRADLSLLSFLRTQLGWSLSLDEKARKAIATEAQSLLALGEKVVKGKATGIGNPAFGNWSSVIVAAVTARRVWDDIENAAVKEMSRLAQSLPCWPSFCEPIRGFGPVSLAAIVGEAGDLGSYSNPAKLWKRMGLAVFDGVRQGGLGKNAPKESWIAHGYNRQRRSRMWNIGDTLIKGNRTGGYRALYLARKEYERERAAGMTPMQVHRRAQRYMEKRLLKNLWQAWRRAMSQSETSRQAPAAIPSAQAERSANFRVSPKRVLPSAKIKRAVLRTSSIKSLPAKRQAKDRSPSSEPMPDAINSAQAESPPASDHVITRRLLPAGNVSKAKQKRSAATSKVRA